MYSSYVELGKERQVFCLWHLIFQNCADIYWRDRLSAAHRAAVGTWNEFGRERETCIQVIENFRSPRPIVILIQFLYNSKGHKHFMWMALNGERDSLCPVLTSWLHRTCAMMVKWLLQWFSLLNVRTIKSYHEVIEWAKPVSTYTFNISDERSTTMLDTIWSVYEGGVEKMKTVYICDL